MYVRVWERGVGGGGQTEIEQVKEKDRNRETETEKQKDGVAKPERQAWKETNRERQKTKMNGISETQRVSLICRHLIH